MNIVLLDAHTANPGDLSWEPLERIAPCTIYPRTALSDTIARCKDAEVILTNKAPITAEMMSNLPKLRYIGVTATGYNIVDTQAAKERGIVVTNVPGYSTPAVAQLVFALILELTNHVGHHAETVRDGRWSACPDFCYWDHPVIELQGRTLGIIGYGEIGSTVAKIGLAFGMKVLANKRAWKDAPPEGVQAASSDEIFRLSDVISLHCPLTEDTRYLIGPRTLALMKPTAFLINTGRGPLVDEAALSEALHQGKIGGAGLDVLSLEPPKADQPLLHAPNCLITPHIGWASREARVRLIQRVADNLKAYLDGKPLNVVNA